MEIGQLLGTVTVTPARKWKKLNGWWVDVKCLESGEVGGCLGVGGGGDGEWGC